MGLLDFFKRREFEEIEHLKQVIKELERKNEQLCKFQQIVDVESFIGKELANFEQRKASIEHDIDFRTEELKKINNEIATKRHECKHLEKEADLYRETIDFSEYGVYEPHFDFDTSEDFRLNITNNRERQKETIRVGSAALGGENMSFNGSLSKGASMVKKEKNLMLRAFNGECDSIIASVEWNNATKMIERMSKSFETINKTYVDQGLYLSEIYLKLKITELELTYEYRLKKHEEREEQRRIKEQIREEERARKEYEKALKDAEGEEKSLKDKIDRIKKELEDSNEAQKLKYELQLQELCDKLKLAEEKGRRALSMAQQTKSGHVYIISNIGSFGDSVYKIGMTRRLEPLDRVRELGDASVPFSFDVHAMIYSDNAPLLESDLHKFFINHQMNKINFRKEFFKVNISDIKHKIEELGLNASWTILSEAAEYRESLAIERDLLTNTEKLKQWQIKQNQMIDNAEFAVEEI